jgi:phosphatidylinositol alpha-1,6-mannosyltransferase
MHGVAHGLVLEGKRIILSVGRLIPRKGHLALIHALPRVLERVPDACLVIVGRGPMMSACSRAAQDLKVREHVRLPGRLPDVEVDALYQLCDVFALPAGEGEGGHVEGFGLVFCEAHAHGKPVIAGSSGGVPEAVLDGETGILIEPDDVEALADALIQVLRDPELARRLGEAGRRRVESELNWRVFALRMMDAFEERR